MKRMKSVAALFIALALIFNLSTTCAMASELKLNTTDATVFIGKSVDLELEGAEEAVWSSADDDIAEVDDGGKVTGKRVGKTTITCTASNGSSCECTVMVTNTYTPTQAYNALIKLKSIYPEGMKWNNSRYYKSADLKQCAGRGCHAFALAVSDAVFGSQPFTKKHSNFNKIKAGDLVRLNNDTHTVVVLKVKKNSIVVAEGNYGGTVHWGRTIKLSTLKKTGNYVMTRYPQKKAKR